MLRYDIGELNGMQFQRPIYRQISCILDSYLPSFGVSRPLHTVLLARTAQGLAMLQHEHGMPNSVSATLRSLQSL